VCCVCVCCVCVCLCACACVCVRTCRNELLPLSRSLCLLHVLSLLPCNVLQRTATHRKTLQHTATHCNTLQHTATHCSKHTLSHTVSPELSQSQSFLSFSQSSSRSLSLTHTHSLCPPCPATHCNTLQHTATYRNKHSLLHSLSPLSFLDHSLLSLSLTHTHTHSSSRIYFLPCAATHATNRNTPQQTLSLAHTLSHALSPSQSLLFLTLSRIHSFSLSLACSFSPALQHTTTHCNTLQHTATNTPL